MELTFDFRLEQSKILGPILRPVAKITLINNKIEVPEYVYVDSGADITLISKSVGELLGFELTKTDSVLEIKGIGERSVPIVIKTAKIKIGEKLLDARIAWALIEDVPLLLGRADVFHLFKLYFLNNKKTVFAE